MASRISELVIDFHGPKLLADFRCGVLGFYVLAEEDGGEHPLVQALAGVAERLGLGETVAGPAGVLSKPRTRHLADRPAPQE